MRSLQDCGDCHAAMKLITEVRGRKIIFEGAEVQIYAIILRVGCGLTGTIGDCTVTNLEQFDKIIKRTY